MTHAVLWMVALLAGCLVPSTVTHAQTTVKYIHTDALGSVVAVTDQNRNVLERREYEPYGLQLTPAVADGPGYTGHVQDAATGLVYMQQRYYDPLGRFLSIDPVTADSTTGENFNRYAYANNNPYKFTDPDGRLGHVAVGGIVGGIISGGVELYKQTRSGEFNGKNLLVETGKGAAVGALTAAVPGSATLAFGGTGAKAVVSVGNAVAVGGAGEVGAQMAKGESVDAGRALVAGAANATGLAVGQAISAPAKAISTTTVAANPGVAVQSLSGRTFMVGATPARSVVSETQHQAIQDSVGESASSTMQEKLNDW